MLLSTTPPSIILPSGQIVGARDSLKPLRVEDIVFMMHRHVLFPGSPEVGARPSLARHALLLAAVARAEWPDDKHALSLACFGMMTAGVGGLRMLAADDLDIETRLMNRFDVPADHRPSVLRGNYGALLQIGEHAHLVAYHRHAIRAFTSCYGSDVAKRSKRAVKDAASLAQIPDSSIPTLLSASLTEHLLSIGGLP